MDSGVGAEEEMGSCISCTYDQLRSPLWKKVGLERSAAGIPHNAPTASTAPNHREWSRYSSMYKSQTCQTIYQPWIRAASQADALHSRARSSLQSTRHQRRLLTWRWNCGRAQSLIASVVLKGDRSLMLRSLGR